MSTIIDEIRKDLLRNSDEKTRISGERFFKENVKLYGIKSAVVSDIGNVFFKKIPDKSKPVIFSLCEELWKSGVMEESFVACNWSYSVRKSYKPADMELFEEWINKYVSNWASCDTFCNHSVGTLVEMYPEKVADLKRWAKSKNRWMKRASAVSLIIPARKGLFFEEIKEISGILLQDKDDMVRKGYGWMLKSASQYFQREVFDYVILNKEIMPRTSLRYAIEKMPPELRKKAMEK